MGLVRQLVETLRIPMVEVAGFEADDVIATLATQAAARGDDVIIVTGDRDTYQLVEDPHIKVLYNRRGVSDYALYDEAGIEDRTGVTPARYPQYAALRGDPSDNLPGVPGVGEKTAAKLINTYGDLDGIYAHLDELSPKLRQSLADAEAGRAGQRRGHPAACGTCRSRSTPPRRSSAGGTWTSCGGCSTSSSSGPSGTASWRPPAAEKEAAPPRRPPASTLEVGAGGAGGSRGGHRVASPSGWPRGVALAVAGAWEGREGRSALAGLAFAALPPAAGPVEVVMVGEAAARRRRRASRPWRACSAPTGSRCRPTTPRP